MWKFSKPIKHPIPETRWPKVAEAEASLLFQPIKVGAITLENRAWVPAMVPWRATEDGFVTQDNLDWYRRFAEGQPAALVVEATGVRDIPSGPLLRIGDDRFLPGLKKLVETVREGSRGHAKLFIQIIDFLAVKRRPDPKKYFHKFLKITDRHRHALSDVTQESNWIGADESRIRNFLMNAPDEIVECILSSRELESLRFGYRERVTDTHLPRVRLPLEVYRAVRQRVGDDYVIGVRFLGDEVIAGGNRIETAVYFGVEFARAGFDYLSISKGGKFEDAEQPKVGQAVYPYTGQSGYECMPTTLSDERGPFGRAVPLVAAIKGAVNKAGFATPIVATGGITTFEQAEGILERGEADIVGLARQALADPDWFLKVKLG